MSKRGMETQGGEERYGGGFGGGVETPADTPTRATAAQMARRQIASLKRRPARPGSPVKPPSLSAFSAAPPASSDPPQGGFAFGSNGTANTSNTFSFSQPQQSSNSFSFGSQPQQPATGGFTFGGAQAQQNGGFTFGGNNNASSMSFPPAGSNPFGATNGAPKSNASGFQGSIFNIPPSSSQQPAPATNGFSFGSAAASPTLSAQSIGLSDSEKDEITRREPYLNSAQQQRLEEIVGTHIPQPSAFSPKSPLESLPSDVAKQVLDYLKSLPSPPLGMPPNAESLFVSPYRGKSKKPWVSDAEREEIKKAAMSLSSADQEKLAQVVKDNVASLKSKANNDLPRVESLPNDAQREMLDFVRGAQGSQRSQSASFEFASPRLGSPSSPAADTETKANPFASIKTTPKAPQTPATGFSFATSTPAPAKADDKAATPAPAFSFSKPAQTVSHADASSEKDDDASKPNPFASVARASAQAGSPAKVDSTPAKSMFGSNATTGAPKTPSSSFTFATGADNNSTTPAVTQSSLPKFSFAQNVNNTTNVSSPDPSSKQPTSFFTQTPQRTSAQTSSQPTFSFPQSTPQPAQPSSQASKSFLQDGSKTPRPASSSSMFDVSSAKPPATAPVQKTLPPSSTSAAPKISFSGAAAVKEPAQTSTSSSTSAALMDIKRFNFTFRRHIKSLRTDEDWSGAAKFYLQQMSKLKAVAEAAKANAASSKPITNSSRTQSQPSQPRQQAQQTFNAGAAAKAAEPAKPTNTSSFFQNSTPGKPLSATASLFSNILDSPEKSQPSFGESAAAGPPPASFQFGAPKGVASPFTAPGSTGTPKPDTSASSNSVPKFGNGPSANFMSAFGAQADKEAAKAKAKRKAEDFDSDEDDEAEWERQDKERQAAKKAALEQQPKQVVKNVGGKFVFVDANEGGNHSVEAPKSVEPPKFSGLPKFGNGPSANFLSSFGAQAAKEAEKAKEKRKAEDFDSDEDDEAEWERQDREKQAAKKAALEQQPKQVVKNVNGKFVFVNADNDSPAATPAAAPSPSKPASLSSFGGNTPSVFANSLSPALSPASNIFGHLSRSQSPNELASKGASDADDESEAEDDGDAEEVPSNGPSTPAPPKTGGLFDRIGKNADGSIQRDGQSTSKPLFSFTKTSPVGDNTWKPESPIKFGGASGGDGATTPVGSPAKSLFSFAPKSGEATPSGPKFDFTKSNTGNLPRFQFDGASSESGTGTAAASPAPSLFANLSSGAGKSTGFTFGGNTPVGGNSGILSAGTSVFGSRATSRATTPGATTADETSTVAGTDNEDEAAPKDEQRDLTSLSAEEERTEDVLFEHKGRCLKFVRGDGPKWETKGVGILRLLRNKETSNHRVLMRLVPSGTVVINANLFQDQSMYSSPQQRAAKLVFAEKEGELATYSVVFKTNDQATELLDKIKEAIA